MLSQLFSRSTAIRRNSFGYRPTRCFPTCRSFPCTVCLNELSQVWGSVQSWGQCVPYGHTLCHADGSEVLRLGRREEPEAQGGSRHRVREDVVFHIERATCSTSWSTR